MMKAKVHGTIGRGVKECYVNDENILIFVMSDGKEVPIGFTGELEGIVPIELGGTNAKNPAGARKNLGITPGNIGAATSAEVDVERNRINNLASLKNGSTTGDAELTDIRVGYDGTTYPTAGEAVRAQVGELKSDLDNLNNGNIKAQNIKGYVTSSGEVRIDGDSESFVFPVKKDFEYNFICNLANKRQIGFTTTYPVVTGVICTDVKYLQSNDNTIKSPIDGYCVLYLNGSRNDEIAKQLRIFYKGFEELNLAERINKNSANTNALFSDIDEIENTFLRIRHPVDNVVAELVYTQGGYYKSDNLFEKDDNWGFTNLIPCESGNIYYTNIDKNSYINFYDINRDFLRGYANKSQTAPPNAKYIRISAKNINQKNILLTVGSTYKNYLNDFIRNNGTLSDGINLDSVRASGLYKLRGNYENAPNISDTFYGASINGTLIVFNPTGATNGQYIIQVVFFAYPFAIYYRIFNSSVWYSWRAIGGSTFGALKDGVDLNSVRDTGMYEIDPLTYSYTNYPLGETKAILQVERGHIDTDAVLQILYPKDNSTYPLFRYSCYGHNTWIPFGKNTDTTQKVKEYTHVNYEPIIYNPRTAIKLKVGTINIGRFNYGSSEYTGLNNEKYDKKLHGWREYFCRQQFDIVNLNEYVPFIDYLSFENVLNGTKKTTDNVLKPQLFYFDTSMDNERKDSVLASKYPLSSEEEYVLSGNVGMNNGYCRYHKITIDSSHVIGVYGIQMPFKALGNYNQESTESILNRLAILSSLELIIRNHNDSYIIIMGDFNTASNSDFSNMATFASDNNLKLCNGGYLDWMRTHNVYGWCLDNILVSNNIHIADFETHNDWYGALSTDHYGISADIILS